jgi:polyhydroxyalkanoate synthesis regulator phasin
MPRNDGYRKYLEAAAVLGEITRARAEELVRELMGTGGAQRAQAQQWVDELVGRSRRAAEDILELVRAEVSNQMQALGLDPEELARQAAEILRRSVWAGRRTDEDASRTTGAAKRGPATKAPATARPATKAPATKAPATARPATKAPTKKAPTKKATAKKATAKKPAAGTRPPAPAR